MKTHYVSTRFEELTVSLACLLSALTAALFGLVNKPPEAPLSSWGQPPHAPELLPWWGRAVYLGGAALLLLVGLAFLPFALRRLRPLTPSIRAYPLLELPPPLAIFVAWLLMVLGTLVALEPVTRYAYRGWDSGVVIGQGVLGFFVALMGLVLAGLRRQTLFNLDTARVEITWGKPLSLFTRSWALEQLPGVFVERPLRVNQTARPIFRVMLALPKGRPIPLTWSGTQAGAERERHAICAWAKLPSLPQRP